jgi:hypothetical protein
MNSERFVSHVKESLEKAEQMQSKVPSDILNMSSCSGSKTRHLLNNLLAFNDARYLDVGTFNGVSVCSAAYGNTCEVTCIDNSPQSKELRDANLEKWTKDVTVIDKDPFRVNVSKDLKKFNVYLYDGPDHSNLGHYRAIQHFYRALDDVFVLVVDDWNWPDVRSSTLNAIKGMRLTKLFEKEMITGSSESSDWWNGLYIAVLEKAK